MWILLHRTQQWPARLLRQECENDGATAGCASCSAATAGTVLMMRMNTGT
jgi:hypothetical protein